MQRNHRNLILFLCILSSIFSGCQQAPGPEAEKAAILASLNGETEAFFNKDYQAWADQWLHESFISKSYMIVTDSTFSEVLSWAQIDLFAKTYMQTHPAAEPLPTLLKDVSVRLYGDGAWVTFEQKDPTRGLKRETRLMEKIKGQWKIAGMHTTVYGFRD